MDQSLLLPASVWTNLKNPLHYLVVSVHKKAYMFEDKWLAALQSHMLKLHKKHSALCVHEVREAIAAAIIGFYHIDGNENAADILSKYWGFRQIWKFLQPLLFWRGDTKDIDALDLYKPPPSLVQVF